jgi:hypothetical protein
MKRGGIKQNTTFVRGKKFDMKFELTEKENKRFLKWRKKIVKS